MSRDLEWLLIRVRRPANQRQACADISQKYNSNVVKRLPEGPLFSKEAVCYLSLHIRVWLSLILSQGQLAQHPLTQILRSGQL